MPLSLNSKGEFISVSNCTERYISAKAFVGFGL